MVLADNGIVCIDEFDKMREEDRVAIHEVRRLALLVPSLEFGGIAGVRGHRCCKHPAVLCAPSSVQPGSMALWACCQRAWPRLTRPADALCSAGHGAADHFHRQGGHHHHAERPLCGACSRQPAHWQLR